MMSDFFENFNTESDPNDPKFIRIKAQREIRTNWEKRIAEEKSVNHESSMMDIDPISIFVDYGLTREKLADTLLSESFAKTIQGHLIDVYNRRVLVFPPNQAFAIADPDETDQANHHLIYHGILVFTGMAYDLRVPVILSKDFDGDQFDFFFALKLMKIPLMRMDDFFDFQMKLNFDGNRTSLVRFLKLLLRNIPTDDNFKEIDRLWTEVPDTWKTSLEEWLAWPETAITPPPIQKTNLKLDLDGQVLPPEPPKPLHEDINEAQFRRALNGLQAIKNKNNFPIISDLDLAYLKAQGPYITLGSTHMKIKLSLSRTDKSKVYNFIYWLWEKFTEAKNRGLGAYAEYLSCYFQNFEGLLMNSLVKSLEPPSHSLKMIFEEAYNKSSDQ